jgi:two-component system response regulator HydG
MNDRETLPGLVAPQRRPTLGGEILVVDDDEATCELIEAVLGAENLRVTWRTHPRAALDVARGRSFDAVLTDLEMGSMDGLELAKQLMGLDPELPVVVVTGHADLANAVRSLRSGVYDFLTKPLDTKLLLAATRRAVERRRLQREVHRLRGEVDRATGFASMVGESRPMQKVFELIDRVSPTDASVLVTGESGTGKELVARALHDRSSRSEGPFVALNSAAVPASLLESELFGHVRGAFTGAASGREGLFLAANHGTLFLDEIGELPLDVQPKLLRALQERVVRPVGGDRETKLDVRIVCATNRDLAEDVARGKFREDLFYRINVVQIDVPPLRDRGSDVLLLAQRFIERIAERHGKSVVGFSEGFAERLLAYGWPGNVRELENAIDRAVALTALDRVEVRDLPEAIRLHRSERMEPEADDIEQLVTLGELEDRYLRRVLRVVEGNKSHAARILGIDRRTLYRKLDRMDGPGNGAEEE